MGSRITRALFKEERKQPIKKEREQEIRLLIVCFLGFINTVYFFLFGYLFRPHVREPHSIALFLAVLILFLFLQLNNVSKAALFTSVALFLAAIASRVLQTELSLLKAALILITTTLSAFSSFEICSSAFLQSLFLWLAYSAFGMGIQLSLAVSKIKIENSDAQVGREETMLVQVVFSLIGVMAIVLINVGKSIMKLKNSDSKKQTMAGKQIIFAAFNFVLIAFAYGLKYHLQLPFLAGVGVVFSALIIFLILKKKKELSYAWICVVFLAISIHTLEFFTEKEEQFAQWTAFGKLLMVDLAIIDSLQRWIGWSNSGTHRPILIVFLYFSAYYLSQFSSLGLETLSHLMPSSMGLIALTAYAASHGLHYFERATAEDYEEVVV